VIELVKKSTDGIVAIKVKGFKSFLNEAFIEIKPLTILSGSNSSGKSSVFQPILLMKQTLDENYDPGALQINGPNVKFSSSSQLISKGHEKEEFYIEISHSNGTVVEVTYAKRGESKAGFYIKKMVVNSDDINTVILLSMNSKEVHDLIESTQDKFVNMLMKEHDLEAKIIRNRCFLELALTDAEKNIVFSRSFSGKHAVSIRNILHLPGLRGNPERNYPVTAVDFEKMNFQGTFEKYVASIIAQWKETKNEKMINKLKTYLKKLGLATNIDAKYINDTEIALYVSRSNNSEDDDVVSIADVGLGLSQTLPILVALLIAREEQIVYIEQPEIHLHPKAQYELALVFSEALKRGVKIIVETHSSVFLRGIQTLVVSKKIDKEQVKLHWFLRKKENGFSYVESADLDENGSFGDWPEDFDDTNIMAETNYLDAVEMRILNE
jgi:predicted ATPase